MTRFYLGVHRANWLKNPHAGSLFLSRNVLLKSRPRRALTRWALDSGAFTEVSTYGRWRTPYKVFAIQVMTLATMGNMEWAATQDYMCEPFIIQKTGLTVLDHQKLTLSNYLDLVSYCDAPFIPILQGYSVDEYMRHAEMYLAAGVNLPACQRVGVGSVCRRQHTETIGALFMLLHDGGLKNLHGFGVKADGLRLYGQYLKSADSMAWSFRSRLSEPMKGHSHKNCANCWEYANNWRTEKIYSLPLSSFISPVGYHQSF